MTSKTEIHDNIVLTAFDDCYYVDVIDNGKENSYSHRWSPEKPTKWTDHQERVNHDLDSVEESLELAREQALEKGVSECDRCGAAVAVGDLETKTGSYVATVCGGCSGSCVGCGSSDWEALGKKVKHSAKHPARFKCTECGHVKKGIITG